MFSTINTPDFIALYARSYPDKKALSDLMTNESWTYARLDQEICQVARLLKAKGCQAGDRVALIARNNIQQIILHFACARLAIIYVPFNWRLSVKELEFLMQSAEPKLLVCDAQSAETIEGVFPYEDLATFFSNALQCDPETEFSFDDDRYSLMLFTSGTSGNPKGVMLSERNLNQSGTNFSVLTAVDRNSCFLCEAPLFHVMGMVANVRTVLQHGGHIYLSDGYKADRTLAWLSDESMGITHYTGVPQMIERLRTQDNFNPVPLRNITFITGGAPHPFEDIRAWLEDGVCLVSGFGMTEVGTALGMPLDRKLIDKKMGSVGLLAPGMKARLVDNDGKDVAPGESGELWLKGDGITQGYWQDEEKTQAVFSDGRWFMTGDIVTVDDEGYYWIIDRKKDMYISGGENVYPAEIEAVALKHPDIEEVAVIGIPDKQWGEVGCLVVVTRGNENISEEAIMQFLRDHLAAYKVPKHFEQVNELPRTKSTGKVQKQELKRKLLEEKFTAQAS